MEMIDNTTNGQMTFNESVEYNDAVLSSFEDDISSFKTNLSKNDHEKAVSLTNFS